MKQYIWCRRYDEILVPIGWSKSLKYAESLPEAKNDEFILCELREVKKGQKKAV